MPSRVVRPETTRLTISNGEWLLIKKRLNHGEQQDAFARQYIATELGHRINLHTVGGIDKVTAYLLDWNLTGLDDQVIPIRGKSFEELTAALNSIDPESFAEILNAIEAHEKAMAVARAEEKKLQAGTGAPSSTSSSLAPITGPSETSES